MNKILVICGPTASGKSARALALAKVRDGVIINADSQQMYRELRILTARPTPEDEAQAEHRLYGVLSASESCSAGKWVALAKAEIERAWAVNKLPILVGGTGMYLSSLIDGIAEIPEISPEVRERVRAMLPAQRLAGLVACDPVMAAKFKPGDTQRISRALEVFRATGKSLSYWQAQSKVAPFPRELYEIHYITLPRAELYARCDARAVRMMEEGAVEEVRALLAQNLSDTLPAMRIIGIREIGEYMTGKCTLEEAVIKLQQKTRNYAKRQETWLRHQLK